MRSLLRGITSALRNLPTLIAVIAKEYNQAHKNRETTKTKLLKPILDTLRKAEILFFTIGFAQLLEIYAGVSLSVQYAYHFPIQMWSKIDAAKSEILALSNDWIWKDEELKLAGIGNPDFLIKDILSDGVFRPFVPEGAIKRHNDKKPIFLYVKFDISGSGQLGLTSGWLRSQQPFIHPWPKNRHNENTLPSILIHLQCKKGTNVPL